ncbi:MAG: hypothetical protein AAFR47_04780 [Pseudomonadota bacterium]
MTRLVLHAGDCKAGSTAIQSVLQRGSYGFEGGGAPKLHYAEGGRRDGLNHHRLADSLHIPRAQSYRDTAWGRFGAEFAELAGQVDAVIVSSERFEFAPPGALHAALLHYAPSALDYLSVVIYVRPHVARLLSGYAQNVRQGLFTGDLAAFLEKMTAEGRFNYAERLIAWRRVFGDALQVRPMIRAKLDGGCVVHDFLGLCLAEHSDVAPRVDKIPVENRSPNPDAVALLRGFHTALQTCNPAPDTQRAALIRRFASRLETLSSFRDGRIELPASLRCAVREAYAEDAARCDAEVFGGPVLAPELAAALANAQADWATPDPIATERMVDLSLTWLDLALQPVPPRR